MIGDRGGVETGSEGVKDAEIHRFDSHNDSRVEYVLVFLLRSQHVPCLIHTRYGKPVVRL